MDDFESRVRARAHRLWLLEGRPPGGADAYYDEARELVAIEENAAQARKPRPRADGVGPSGATLTDQGEESTHPHKRGGR